MRVALDSCVAGQDCLDRMKNNSLGSPRGNRVRSTHARLCALCVTCVVALLGLVSNAAAQGAQRGEVGAERGEVGAERGEVGAELHTMWVGSGGQLLWLGASAWYRLQPAIALGLTAETNIANYGGEGLLLDGQASIQGGARILKAFVDYRVAPTAAVGVFGRLSVGIADVQPIYPNGGTSGGRWGSPGAELITELEGGPEFRIFFSSKRESPRPALFLRLGGSFTLLAPRAFPGAVLTLGGEG